MNLDSAGYLRPRQIETLSAQETETIAKTCPAVVLKHDEDTPFTHPLWGPIRSLYTGFANDSGVRHQGSSGGIVSALLIYLLETSKVDYVLHIGASQEHPLRNEVYLSTLRTEVLHHAGSRYAPSAPLKHIHEFLEQSGIFAVVGKPCDIAALRRYSKYDPRVTQKIPYMLSFLCAGIPSEIGSKQILKTFGVPISEVKAFRYRGEGWPGSTKVETRDGQTFEMSYNQAWGQTLNRHLQFRCKICPDGTGEFADIAAGDAWYGDDKGFPDFSERKGRSLIIVRTRRGKTLLEEAQAAGYLKTELFPIEELEKIQQYQANRRRLVLSRLAAIRLSGHRIPHYIGFNLLKNARNAGIKKNLISFLGTLRRLWSRPYKLEQE